MTKQYHIHLTGKQREQIDVDLMAQIVVMLGSQMAEDARQAIAVGREAREAETGACQTPEAQPDSEGRRTP